MSNQVDMADAFFVLGRNPALSLAEIVEVIPSYCQSWSISHFSDEVAVFSLSSADQLSEITARLGGTVKSGSIHASIPLEDSQDRLDEVFSTEILTKWFIRTPKKKLHIGISVYNAGGDKQLLRSLEKKLQDFNMMIKENLKEGGYRVGFVRVRDRYLSSVSVVKNNLLSSGFEVVLLLTPQKLFVGRTTAVQEFGFFSARDVGRPSLDKRSGIMPPKLARMMINLGGIDKDAVLCDPFCGSGTIVQEAVVLGCKTIHASDVSQKAIVDTKSNIAWLQRRFPVGIEEKTINIFQADVRTISNRLTLSSVDMVVTEPYLGPPLHGKPDRTRAQQILFEVKGLYGAAFAEFAKVLKPNGRIVIIFPAFQFGQDTIYLDILDDIRSSGFFVAPFFPEHMSRFSVNQLTKRESILYGSPGQFVMREIIRFVKT